MSVVQAEDLFFLYPTPRGDIAALRGLNVEVGGHEVVSVLGPSGAGKSTLLTLCAGTHRPSSGKLTVLGVPMEAASPRLASHLRQTQIGVVHQHYHRALPRELAAEEIIALPLRLLGRFGPAEQRHVSRLLRQAGLSARATARPFELSGGEQQRVAVCAALAKRPRLLLADEPTGELDPRTSMAVLGLLLQLVEEAGASALIVTHDSQVALQTDRTIHIRDGRLSAEGATNPVLILDQHGWLRLPEELREQAGVQDRVRASATWGRIELLADDLTQGGTADIQREDAPTQQPHPFDGQRPPAEISLNRVMKTYSGAATAGSVIGEFSRTLAPGQLHVFAGPSGSGKTTLLNLIAGLERPDSGEIWVGDERVDTLDPDQAARWRGRTIGYLSQHSTLVPFMSALENVELGLVQRGLGSRDAAVLGNRWLDWVGLDALPDRRADRLSGGEQRRVALARAFAHEPRVLIADEPTAYLDRAAGRMVIALLERVVRECRTTVIAASHDPDVIAAATSIIDLAAVAGRPSAPAAPTAGDAR